MKRFLSLLCAMALMVSIFATSLLTPFTKVDVSAAGGTLVLGNGGYPAGSYDETLDQVKIKMVIGSGDATSYQWQKSTDGTTFTNIEGETSAELVDFFEDEIYVRCVVNGNVKSETIQLLLGDSINSRFEFPYYFSNGSMAYSVFFDTEEGVKEAYFDVIGKYTYTDEADGLEKSEWIQTSYDYYWSIHSSASPSDCSEDYDESVSACKDVLIHFDTEEPWAVLVSVDLGDTDTCLSVSADVKLGTSGLFGDYADDAAIKAVLNEDKTLKAIDMITAPAIDVAKDTDAAFLLRPITPASKFCIDEFSEVVMYDYHIADAELKQASDFETGRDVMVSYLSDYYSCSTEEELLAAMNSVLTSAGAATVETVDEGILAILHACILEGIPEGSSPTSTTIDEAMVEYTSIDLERPSTLETAKRFFLGDLYDYVTGYATIGEKKVVTLLEGEDSGVSVCWTDLTPGSTVEFAFSVGTVADTGAADVAESDRKSYTSGGTTMTDQEIETVLEEDSVAIETGSALGAAGISSLTAAIAVLDDEDRLNTLIGSALTLGDISVVMEDEEEVLKATLDTTDASVIKAVLNPVDLIKTLAGECVTITLVVTKNDSEASSLGTAGEKIMDKVAEGKDVLFFDSELFVKVGDAAEKNVTEFGGNITISVTIPNDIYVENETYGVILSHKDAEGNITSELVTGVTQNGKVITFSVNKLCLMAITYTKATAPDDGNTDDGNTDDGNTDDGNTDDGNTNDGNTDDVITGDGNDARLWITLLLVGLGVATGMIVFTKKSLVESNK